jgi:hypothetical protein
MNRYDDDLGRLIRISLSRSAVEVEPSAEVWARIEARIRQPKCDSVLCHQHPALVAPFAGDGLHDALDPRMIE